MQSNNAIINENAEKAGVLGQVTEGFRKSTRSIREINKENMEAIMVDTRMNHAAMTAPDPGLVKVREAEGLKNKVKAIGENIKEGARANSIKEKQRREEIQSNEVYREILYEQRVKRQDVITKNVRQPFYMEIEGGEETPGIVKA